MFIRMMCMAYNDSEIMRKSTVGEEDAKKQIEGFDKWMAFSPVKPIANGALTVIDRIMLNAV